MAPVELPPKLKESVENSKCEYRRLGKSGLLISVPIFGCMSFGDPKCLPWAIGEDEVSQLRVPLLNIPEREPINKDRLALCTRAVTDLIRLFLFSKQRTIKGSTPGTRPMFTPTACLR